MNNPVGGYTQAEESSIPSFLRKTFDMIEVSPGTFKLTGFSVVTTALTSRGVRMD